MYTRPKDRIKEAVQQRMQIFLSLNQERIEKMSREAREQKEKYNQSKPYIKPYKEKSLSTLVSIVSRQQSCAATAATLDQDYEVRVISPTTE